MDLRTVILRISFLVIFCKMLAFGYTGQDERKCLTTHSNRMLKIRCYDMNLKEVPQYLKSSVEVLDLSYNRIKKLKTSSFQKYTSVKYLFLFENMINSVEPGTFEPLTSLEEIDLSNNVLFTIPLEIFQLPSLRNLYAFSNDMVNLNNDLQALHTPVRAPLEYINLAECSLKELPNFGILPNLWHINVSSNPLTDLQVDQFFAMCNLRSADLTKTSMNDCTCHQVNNHFLYIGAEMKYLPVCKKRLQADTCPMNNETLQTSTFGECKNAAAFAKAKSTWIFAAGCAGGVLIVLLMIWCCISRRRKKRNKRKKAALARKQYVVSPKNAINIHPDDELLHCDTA